MAATETAEDTNQAVDCLICMCGREAGEVLRGICACKTSGLHLQCQRRLVVAHGRTEVALRLELKTAPAHWHCCPAFLEYHTTVS